MKVYAITTDTLALPVVAMGNRLYRIARDTKVEVLTDVGNFVFRFKAGYVFVMRTEGVAVDLFVDQLDDEKKALCYLVHDAIYTPCAMLGMEHPVSRIRGDQLLRAALLYSRMHEFKACVVYNSVRLFGHNAYWRDDALTSANSKLFSFEWVAKKAG